MKVFKFHPPYKPNGRCSFPETKERTGIYLIKENDKLVYIGFSGVDLYKTMYRHFQQWTDRPYKGAKALPAALRVTYKDRMKRNKYTVRIVFCTAQQAARLEKMLIIKHQPRDNNLKYENYNQTIWDTNIVEAYSEAPVERDCPF
jgi:hypothetical protein